MIGMPSNLKWKFLINTTTIMEKFVALLKRLHRKIWQKKTKIALKNRVFEFIDLKTTLKGQGTPIFFSILLNQHVWKLQKKFQAIFFKNGRDMTI